MLTVIENLIVIVINLLVTVIIVDAVLSFIPNLQDKKLAQIIKRISFFFINPVRKITPSINIGLDLAPLVAILLLKIAQGILIRFVNLLF